MTTKIMVGLVGRMINQRILITSVSVSMQTCSRGLLKSTLYYTKSLHESVYNYNITPVVNSVVGCFKFYSRSG